VETVANRAHLSSPLSSSSSSSLSSPPVSERARSFRSFSASFFLASASSALRLAFASFSFLRLVFQAAFRSRHFFLSFSLRASRSSLALSFLAFSFSSLACQEWHIGIVVPCKNAIYEVRQNYSFLVA